MILVRERLPFKTLKVSTNKLIVNQWLNHNCKFLLISILSSITDVSIHAVIIQLSVYWIFSILAVEEMFVVFITGRNKGIGALALIKFKASPQECIFAIENHCSLAKYLPLLSVASYASRALYVMYVKHKQQSITISALLEITVGH